MKNINIIVENKRATVVGSPVIICGNSDYTVTFTFDAEWTQSGARTARFVYVKGGEVQHEDVVFTGNTVAVPVLSDVTFVNVGVFEGDLCTTTPARVNCHPSILCGSGIVPAPTPDVYSQIMALFNELAAQGVGGATEEQAQQIRQNKQDIAELADGTKKAGDASKLEGKSASEFRLWHNGDITSFNAAVTRGKYRVNGKDLDGAPHTGNIFGTLYNEIADGKQYGDQNGAWLTQIFIETNRKIYTRQKINGNGFSPWDDWSDAETLGGHGTDYFFPKSGGTLDGSVRVASDGADDMQLGLANSARNVFQEVTPSGNYYLYDNTHDKYIIRSLSDGTTTLGGTASGNLPLTGGRLTGGVDISMATPFIDFVSDDSKDYTIRFIENGRGVLDIINGDNNGKRLRIDTDALTGVNIPLHSGNYSEYALPNTGGEIAAPKTAPLSVHNSSTDGTNIFLAFKLNTSTLGYLGFKGADNPVVYSANMGTKTLHHDGNSAKVHIGTSAPSDTSALWIDTSA